MKKKTEAKTRPWRKRSVAILGSSTSSLIGWAPRRSRSVSLRSLDGQQRRLASAPPIDGQSVSVSSWA